MNATGFLARSPKCDSYIQHEVRRTLFLHAMGGPINTGGLGAVALRCDHGLQSFRDKVLPLASARRIKIAQAYNPRNWHYPENATVSPEDLNSWVEAGDVEIWNHSANHWGVSDQKALHDQIVGGLSEIQKQLPAAKGSVWGFAPPSVSKGDYLGFRNGATPAQWGTYAGRLILRHHAIASGYLPGTAHRVLDGQIRDGLGHITIERFSVSDIKAQIDIAVAERSGLQMMLHPSQLDNAGRLSTRGLEEVLDYLVDLRASGRVSILSPYELIIADSRNAPSNFVGAWTELDGHLSPGIDAHNLRIRKAGDTAHVDLGGLRLPLPMVPLTDKPLPLEFRPTHPQFINFHTPRSGPTELEITTGGNIIAHGPTNGIARGNAFYWLS